MLQGPDPGFVARPVRETWLPPGMLPTAPVPAASGRAAHSLAASGRAAHSVQPTASCLRASSPQLLQSHPIIRSIGLRPQANLATQTKRKARPQADLVTQTKRKARGHRKWVLSMRKSTAPEHESRPGQRCWRPGTSWSTGGPTTRPDQSHAPKPWQRKMLVLATTTNRFEARAPP